VDAGLHERVLIRPQRCRLSRHGIFLPQKRDVLLLDEKHKDPFTIVWISGEAVTGWAQGQPLNERPVCGYGDKVLELRPDVAVPRRVRIIGK
jgi:hypothetical protein